MALSPRKVASIIGPSEMNELNGRVLTKFGAKKYDILSIEPGASGKTFSALILLEGGKKQLVVFPKTVKKAS